MNVTVLLGQAIVAASKGVAVGRAVLAIAQASAAGKSPTDSELVAGQQELQTAVEAWDAAADKDRV